MDQFSLCITFESRLFHENSDVDHASTRNINAVKVKHFLKKCLHVKFYLNSRLSKPEMTGNTRGYSALHFLKNPFKFSCQLPDGYDFLPQEVKASVKKIQQLVVFGYSPVFIFCLTEMGGVCMI